MAHHHVDMVCTDGQCKQFPAPVPAMVFDGDVDDLSAHVIEAQCLRSHVILFPA